MDNQVDHQGFLFPSEIATAAATSIQPWPLSAINSFGGPCPLPANYGSPLNDRDRNFFASEPPSSIYGDLYYRRGLHLSHDHGLVGNGAPSDPLGLSSLYAVPGAGTSSFGSLHAELMSKMSAQEVVDAKAQAASKSHSEAERRRRERINAHLARLRSLLPSTTKTDKASLLAEVIQHVKELKRQTSAMAEDNPLPTEADELTVDATSNDDGRFVVRASLCCQDRSDLIPDLIKALKSLRLRPLKAEITTLGGRVKNILVITGEDDDDGQQFSIPSIHDALKAVMERSAADESQSAGGIKRQRTNSLSGLLHQRSL